MVRPLGTIIALDSNGNRVDARECSGKDVYYCQVCGMEVKLVQLYEYKLFKHPEIKEMGDHWE